MSRRCAAARQRVAAGRADAPGAADGRRARARRRPAAPGPPRANGAAAAAARAATQITSTRSTPGVSTPRRPGSGRRPSWRAKAPPASVTSAGQSVTVTVRATVDYADPARVAGTVPSRRPPTRPTECDGERHAVRWRGSSARSAAFAVLLATVVAVPVLLVLLVGNPWPGRTRIELGDEVAIVVGVLAVLGWLVWLRFVVAVVDRAARSRSPSCGRRRPTRPADRTRRAAAVADRRRAAGPAAGGGGPRPASAVGRAVDRPPSRDALPTPAARAQRRRLPVAPVASPCAGRRRDRQHGDGRATGDTLIGLARSHLGDAERWREIFELNRDARSPTAPARSSPSDLAPAGRSICRRCRWRPRRPPAPAAPYAAPATLVVAAGRQPVGPHEPGWPAPACPTTTSPSPATCRS